VDEVDPWKVYQVDGPEYLNDLAELAFGRGYWISATEAVTIYMAPQAWDVSLPPEPPDTHYGVVLGGEGFTPTVGMEVQARIGSAACGQGTVVEYGGDMVYVVDVMADDGGAYAGCGADGRSIAFYVGGQAVAPSSRWDNRQVSHVDLRPRSGGDLYLPVVLRRY
jgi:hypothetical protein